MRIQTRADLDFVPPGVTAPPTRMGELCKTPCVADLPPGKYKLYLTAAGQDSAQGDVDVLEVREGTNYYLRAPGRFEPPRWIHVAPTLVFMAGLAAVVAGAALAANPEDTGRQTAGLLVIGGGVALTVVGGVYYYNESRGVTQEGATTSWVVPPQRP